MANYDSNYAIAQEISARIGNAPIPFDSVYSIALQIYQELGGEESEFDSVYSILLGILPLAESVAKKTSITEVDELPDAYDNNNIYRLSSDDKVYMSKHVSTEYTNRLPDEQQIDKSYIFGDGEPENPNVYYYKGLWKIICSDGEIEYYGWLDRDYLSGDWVLFLTNDDAENFNVSTTLINSVASDDYEGTLLDVENKTVTILEAEKEEYIPNRTFESSMGDCYYIPATYNAPEAGCIGNATCKDNQFSMTATYTGEEVEYTDEDTHEHCIGYKWNITDDDTQGYDYIVTSKKASEIYYVEGRGVYTDTIVRIVVDGVGEYTGFETLDIPQLNAPDSEQVGKAYLFYVDEKHYYTGIEKTVVLADRTFNVYLWGDDEESPVDWDFITFKPANQIYGGNDLGAADLDTVPGWTVDGNTVTNTGITYAEFVNDCVQSIADWKLSIHNIVPYQRTIEHWEWEQIPTMDDIPQPIEIKLESTSETELAKLNDFTETGVYNNINLQVKYNNRYCPATLEVLKQDEEIFQDITFSDLAWYDSRYLINRHFYQEWENGYLKVLDETISIANTGNTQMAQLNGYTTPGIYDGNTLKLKFLGYPAQLIVGEYVQSNIKFTSQWIKYYNPQYLYSEYVYARHYNHSTKQWENNPGGEYPIKIHEVD